MKVCHLTSAHPQEDIRIFHKECCSLANSGYQTYQISCGTSYEKNGVKLIGIGPRPNGRLRRMTQTAKRVYKEAIKLDADIYHFHDPELLRYGKKLKHRGKTVIFDSHEDIPGQIMDKTWIPKNLRRIISRVYRSYETSVVKVLDAVVVATPHIKDKFSGRARIISVVNNYPKLDDIIFHDDPFKTREPIVCYAGGISENRGHQIMIDAMKEVEGTLIIAGDHPIQVNGNISYPGRLNRPEVNDLYRSAVVGLCILKPIDNYYYSQPIKMYEYMAAGIPFVCSDFPKWRDVAERSGAGICVDPTNIKDISDAINWLLNNRNQAQEMGRKGHEFVMRECNWNNEEKALLELYRQLH